MSMGERLCEAGRCRCVAYFRPYIRVWAFGGIIHRDSDSLLLTMDLALCRFHARNVTLKDLVTPEEWLHTSKRVLSNGYPEPCRDTARLEVRYLLDNSCIHSYEVH